jgi:hypothetical protein
LTTVTRAGKRTSPGDTTGASPASSAPSGAVVGMSGVPSAHARTKPRS